jgi:hypothetical protein
LLVIACKIELDGKQQRLEGSQKLPNNAASIINLPNFGLQEL